MSWQRARLEARLDETEQCILADKDRAEIFYRQGIIWINSLQMLEPIQSLIECPVVYCFNSFRICVVQLNISSSSSSSSTAKLNQDFPSVNISAFQNEKKKKKINILSFSELINIWFCLKSSAILLIWHRNDRLNQLVILSRFSTHLSSQWICHLLWPNRSLQRHANMVNAEFKLTDKHWHFSLCPLISSVHCWFV